MAKQQTFGDKLKKKKGEDYIVVKVIKGQKSDSGSNKFNEQFVKLKDLNEVTKVDIK